MRKITQDELLSLACRLLEDGTVSRVLGWRRGEFDWDMTPAVFTKAEDIENNFIYNDFCGANLSKYLLRQTRKIQVQAQQYDLHDALNLPYNHITTTLFCQEK